jgi:PAS domain S-box-containing protein
LDAQHSPWPEPARLAALSYYQILDTSPEAEFDDITSLAAQICDTPIALISLIDHNRQWFKSKIGLEFDETPRDIAICDHAIRHGGFFVVPDATLDPRFRDNPLVTGKEHLRFYAGAPLIGREQMPLGTVCVLDAHARQIDAAQKRALEQLARQTMSLLELRALRKLRAGPHQLAEAFCTLDRAYKFSYVSRSAETLLGATSNQLEGEALWSRLSRSDHTKPVGSPRRGFAEEEFDGFEAFCRATNKWLHLRIQPSPLGFGVYLNDTTTAHREKDELALLKTAVSRLNDVVIICEAEPIDAPGPKVVFVNDAFTRATGYTPDEIIGRSPRMLQGAGTQPEARQQIRAALENWRSVRTELINYKKNGEEFWLELDIAPIADRSGWFTHWVAVERNITERKQHELLRDAESQIFKAISFGTTLNDIFAQILAVADGIFAGSRTSITSLDSDGVHMRHGAALNLPADFTDLIDGHPIGPNIGSCGTAMYRRETIIVTDIASDPLWADYRILALAISIRACWSIPVIGRDGSVLASFAIYWPTPKAPTPADLALAERFSHLVGLVMEHARQEDALRESEFRFRQVVDAIDELFWMSTGDKSIVYYVSPAYETIWRRPARELYENPLAWFDAIHEDDKPWVAAKRLGNNNDMRPIEYRIRRPDGSIRWIRDTIFPVLNREGKVTRLVGIAKDITEDKHAKASLEESEQRSRLIATITTDAIWEWDIASQKYWWGEGIQSVFGHKLDDVDDQRLFHDYIDIRDRRRVFESIRAAVEGDARNWSAEYNFTRSDGSTAVVVNKAIIIRDDAGIAIRLVGGMSDVTAQRESQERQAQLQRLDAVGQLSGGIAHDFNNLLQVILANSEYLQEALPHGELASVAELITAAADQGSVLIERLLTFSRRQSLQAKPADVTKLIIHLESLLRRTLGENIEITLSYSATVWAALVDAAQLETALLNLAINSRDAMPQGGRLSIEIENVSLDESHSKKFEDFVPGDYVMITVTDNGSGMDESTLSHAFDPFFTTKDVGKGTGLGLSMVYGFVKQSNGFLSINSFLGVGTIISMYLPRAVTSAEEAPPITRTEKEIHGSGRILVVEDNDLVRSQVAMQLQAVGYDVVQAQNASDALAMLASGGTFDLIFTDIIMPGGMNGYQLATEARKLFPGIHILLTTGYSDQMVKNLSGLDPDVSLISKPYHRRELSLKLQELIGVESVA